MLDPLGSWQRRITGGVMLQFFEFAGDPTTQERYPILGRDPLSERVFVCVTDVVGAVAFGELVDRHSDRAICVFQSEWRSFLEQEDADDEFECHYEFWSAWHRELDPRWEVGPAAPGHQLWVHEEGLALALGVGRGAQHLWAWDGRTMTLQEQGISSWSSEEGADRRADRRH